MAECLGCPALNGGYKDGLNGKPGSRCGFVLKSGLFAVLAQGLAVAGSCDVVTIS